MTRFLIFCLCAIFFVLSALATGHVLGLLSKLWRGKDEMLCVCGEPIEIFVNEAGFCSWDCVPSTWKGIQP